MITLVAYICAVALLGLIALGHIVVLRALFSSADHPDGRRDRVSEGRLPHVPV